MNMKIFTTFVAFSVSRMSESTCAIEKRLLRYNSIITN